MRGHAPNGRAGLIAGALLTVLACGNALAGPPYVTIEQRLSADQMHATGLDQLRPEQLSLLNQLLHEQQDNVAAESAAAERDRKQREATETVTSTLKGEFRGWETGTVLELANGQRWRVVGTGYYTPRRIADAKVTVEPGAFGSWFLQVEGTNASTKVKRIEP
jgi:hypothetical protein